MNKFTFLALIQLHKPLITNFEPIFKLFSIQIQPTDKISILGLASIAPGKQVDCEIKHADGKVDKIKLNQTLNDQQITWFKAGSALNRMKQVASGK